MESAGIDALVLAEPANVRYFTGLRSWFTTLPPVLAIVAVITTDPASSTLVDTTTERGSIEAATWIENAELYGGHDDPIETLVAALRRRGLATGRLGFELGSGRLPHLSPSDLMRLRSQLPEAEVIDASDLLHAARALKSDAEITLIRRSVELIVRAFRAVCERLRPGMTEIEMTRIALREIVDAGGEPELNPPVLIFMAGKERYRQPLLPSTSREVKRNELISLDGGAGAQGYHSDFARGAVIGSLSAEARRQFDAVVGALAAAQAAIAVGRPIGDAWAAAEAQLREAGLAGDAVNPNNIGHSIGLDHWERPTIARPGTPMGDVRARAGMVLCIEPQVAGSGGDDAWENGLFLVEDQLLVKNDGVEVLTAAFPRELYVVGG